MPSISLHALLEMVPVKSVHASGGISSETCMIDGLVFDSRNAGPGKLFFALPGTHTDGHSFVAEVIAKGCPAVVVTNLPEEPSDSAFYVQVEDTRKALSPFSAAFYGHPSRELTVIGVTGTDGKSSTVSYIHQLLELSGKRAGFFSTVQWKSGEAVQHNQFRQSTPEAPQIHGLLREMIQNGKEFAVLESTSHGLSPKTNRLGDVIYSCAVFTNVTIEHLEFHGTVENYRRDKARLFEALEQGPIGAFGVVNLDDPNAQIFIDAAGPRDTLTYSTQHPEADLYAKRISEFPDRIELELVWKGSTTPVTLFIPGRFNAENLMAALLAVSGCLSLQGNETSPLDLIPLVPQLRSVKGRMSPVLAGQPFSILIDYAHTPGAFEKLLPAIREVTRGQVFAVFGSGGERDREKRPLQGALADRWTDVVILTDEDPRLEGSTPIIEDIAKGIRSKKRGETLWTITPRREALKKAFSLAKAGDTVLLLGKGHEQSIVTANGSEPYDEESTAREILAELGWTS